MHACRPRWSRLLTFNPRANVSNPTQTRVALVSPIASIRYVRGHLDRLVASAGPSSVIPSSPSIPGADFRWTRPPSRTNCSPEPPRTNTASAERPTPRLGFYVPRLRTPAGSEPPREIPSALAGWSCTKESDMEAAGRVKIPVARKGQSPLPDDDSSLPRHSLDIKLERTTYSRSKLAICKLLEEEDES